MATITVTEHHERIGPTILLIASAIVGILAFSFVARGAAYAREYRRQESAHMLQIAVRKELAAIEDVAAQLSVDPAIERVLRPRPNRATYNYDLFDASRALNRFQLAAPAIEYLYVRAHRSEAVVAPSLSSSEGLILSTLHPGLSQRLLEEHVGPKNEARYVLLPFQRDASVDNSRTLPAFVRPSSFSDDPDGTIVAIIHPSRLLSRVASQFPGTVLAAVDGSGTVVARSEKGTADVDTLVRRFLDGPWWRPHLDPVTETAVPAPGLDWTIAMIESAESIVDEWTRYGLAITMLMVAAAVPAALRARRLLVVTAVRREGVETAIGSQADEPVLAEDRIASALLADDPGEWVPAALRLGVPRSLPYRIVAGYAGTSESAGERWSATVILPGAGPIRIRTEQVAPRAAGDPATEVEDDAPIAGASAVHAGLDSVRTAFREALQALEHGVFFGLRGRTSYPDLPEPGEPALTLPLEEETRLANAIAAGESDAATEVVRSAVSHALSRPDRDVAGFRLFSATVAAVALRAIGEHCPTDPKKGPGNIVRIAQSPRSATEIEDELLRLVERGVASVRRRTPPDRDHILVESVKRYVDDRYGDINLGVADIGFHFDLTPSYVSRIFRDHVGLPLLAFIHQTRIEKAKTLLAESQLPIKTIARAVGFQESSTFIRIFKRRQSITPGAYRRNVALMSFTGSAG